MLLGRFGLRFDVCIRDSQIDVSVTYCVHLLAGELHRAHSLLGVRPKSWGQLGAKTRDRIGRKLVICGVRSADSTGLWRKRVGVEPTTLAAKDRINGFEGHEGHRTPFASARIIASIAARRWRLRHGELHRTAGF